jgi:hypothetical protein
MWKILEAMNSPMWPSSAGRLVIVVRSCSSKFLLLINWELLLKGHEGDRFPEHTLAILIFTMHARKRGWATQVLPPVQNTNAAPDALVLKGSERWYVEVELSQKENLAKWKNLAALNGGKVAICAATPEYMTRLAGDCRLANLPGIATELQTLVKGTKPYKAINEQTPFWLESW